MTSARGRAEERPERANCLVGPRRRFRGRSRPFGLVNKQSRLSRSASFDRNCLRRRATPSSPVHSTPRWLGPDRASLCISSPQCAPDIASEWGGLEGGQRCRTDRSECGRQSEVPGARTLASSARCVCARTRLEVRQGLLIHLAESRARVVPVRGPSSSGVLAGPGGGGR